MEIRLVYITVGDEAEARRIGRALIEARLAACVNIHGRVQSLYRWDGAIQEDTEVVLIAKTRESLVRDLTEKVLTLHSYDCPCIVAMPVSGGNPAFLNWVVEETA
ncbi:MAG: divalent-cation tolerance protein CutA [Rhodospirillaceae bacterium]|jgi:periplasmic divalent cation tolerance protein|nr:divalent-cation tolerance protein CutA [Rhodospirillaceae bacterium]MBT5667824.1 divalent-cation tolerance protein CutA [Rhodospirillaceae bacterium]MBT5811958.1 divalent-cation tolerance protein CutA [Rhodospirillaceae bacterium]